MIQRPCKSDRLACGRGEDEGFEDLDNAAAVQVSGAQK